MTESRLHPRSDLPVPARTQETEVYWQAATEARLLVRRCHACGEAHHYPRSLCPFCFSPDTVWEQACGRGTVYSFSVMRRAEVPYAIAYVTLEEGPTLMTNIVNCALDDIAIGLQVVLVGGTDAPSIPMFTPVAGSTQAGINP